MASATTEGLMVTDATAGATPQRPGATVAVALLLLATGLAATVVLGPLGLGLLQWRVGPSGLIQLYGAHLAELVLVVPVAVGAAWLWRGHHRLAPALALGAAQYALYVAVQDVLFPDYSLYPGNNERFYPLFLGLLILSWTVACRAWAALDQSPPLPPRWLLRGFAALLLLLSAVIGFAWTAQVLAIALTGAATPDYAEAPSGFWVIRTVDLGVVIPISLWTAIGLWHGRPAAIKTAYALASFLTLELGAVLAMGLVQLWRRDPSVSPVLVYVLAPIFLVLAMLTVRLLASYASGSGDVTPRMPHRPVAASETTTSSRAA
jgi:hypothetical protein